MTGPLRLGLTGGIGSGKSTVAHLLVEQGAALIDADAISRAITAAHGAAIPHIRAQFGQAFLTAEQAMDRERMRGHIYDNPRAKKDLEAIIHPLVRQAVADQEQTHRAAGRPCIVFDIPLLVESGQWRSQLDRVLVIDCRAETQIERVCARNAIPSSEVHKIIASQAKRQQRLQAADIVLYNDDLSLQQLSRLVRDFGARIGL